MDIKRIKSICTVCVSAIAILFVTVVAPVMNVKASVYEEYVEYAEPSTSDTQGYLTVLLKNNSTGANVLRTFFWYCAAATNGYTSPCYMYLNINSDYIDFAPGGISNADSAYYSLSAIDEESKLHVLKYSSSERLHLTFNGYTVYAFNYSGNVGQVVSNITNQSFSVHWSTDSTVSTLQLILQNLVSLKGLTNSQLSALAMIYNKSADIDTKLVEATGYLKTIMESNNLLVSLSQTQVQQLYCVLDKLEIVVNELTFADKHVLNEMRAFLISINGRLEQIYKQLYEQSQADKAQTDKFAGDSKQQTDKINELNKENKTDKVDVNSAGSSVDDNLDMEAVGSYGMLLSVFTGNTHIVTYLLVVFAVALISYVLFGKR